MNPRLFIEEASRLSGQIIAWRRDFHKHPELGFKEFRTSKIVAEVLASLGLDVQESVAETGVVGLMEGSQPGPTILLRFDMDALPIQELSEVSYASIQPGVMHACGHDGHIAMGLGVAQILRPYSDKLRGRLKFVFQPAEEGLGGALRMIEEGVLKDPAPEVCLAMHLWNEKPEGWLGISPGPIMAGADVLKITVHGKGGHAAAPHQARDPVLVSAQIVTALQSIISRNVDPLQAGVVSLTQIQAGEAFNVIPERATLRGTIRTFEPEVRQIILQRVMNIANQIAAAFDCQVEVEIKKLNPPLVNDPGLTALAQAVAEEQFSDIHLAVAERSMVSEDMAYMMETIPGCFILVGSADSQEGLSAAHHHPCFDFKEAALVRGVALLSGIVYRILGVL